MRAPCGWFHRERRNCHATADADQVSVCINDLPAKSERSESSLSDSGGAVVQLSGPVYGGASAPSAMIEHGPRPGSLEAVHCNLASSIIPREVASWWRTLRSAPAPLAAEGFRH